MGFGVWGLGFRVGGLAFRVWCLRFKGAYHGFGFLGLALGFRGSQGQGLLGSGLRVFGVLGCGLKFLGGGGAFSTACDETI